MSKIRRLRMLEQKKQHEEIYIPCLCEIFYESKKCRCREVHKLMGKSILTIQDLYGKDDKLQTYPDNTETEALIQKLNH